MTLASTRAILEVLSRLGLVSAALMAPCLLFAAFEQGPASRTALGFLVPILLALGFFGALRFAFGRERPVLKDTSEGFSCVVLGWVLFCALGALPFWIAGVLPRFVDGWFESVSGYTTCGASVFASVEPLPRAILLWRALTHLAGGLGIIALYVAVLPALGAGGIVLFKSEAQASVFEDRLRPRIQDTAKTLLWVYLGLVAAQTVVLWLACGLPAFDAFCHAAATLSTGGFSTRDTSLAAYGPGAQWVTTLFMLLGGTSFLLHNKALVAGPGVYLRNAEFRSYLTIALCATLAVFTVLWLREPSQASVVADPHALAADLRPRDLHTTARDAAFAVASALTCTGFATADFEGWPDFCGVLLLLLVVIGGCTASTAGGMKVSRVVVFLRTVGREVQTLLRPSRVLAVRFGHNTIGNDALVAICIFLLCWVMVVAIGIVALTASGLAAKEAISGAIACMGNFGPGLGAVGPATNYGDTSTFAKTVFTALMLLGRLEIFAVFAMFASLKRH